MAEDDLKSANIDVWGESLKTSVSSFFGVLADVLHVMILVRFLPQGEVGVFFISYAFLYLFSQIPRGFGVAIRKRASEMNNGRSKYLWTGFILIIPMLLLLYGGLWLGQPLLNEYSSVTLSRSVLVALFFATTGFSLLEFARYYMAGLGKPGRAETMRTSIAKTSMPILTVVLLSINPTVEFALFAVFVAYFGTSIIMFGVSPHTFCVPSRETVVDILHYSKWSVSTAILNDFYHRWDTILLGVMVGSVAVSFYDSSGRIAFLATTFAVGVSKTSNVKMSGMNELGRDIRDIAGKTLEVSTFLIFPLLLLTLFNAEYLLSVLFGSEYVGANIYLILLVVVQVFQAYRMQFESIFNSTDTPRNTTKTSFVAVLFNIVTAPFLVMYFGGYGVLYSTLLAELVRVIAYEVQVRELLDAFLLPGGVFKQYISVGIVASVLYGLKQVGLSRPVFLGISFVLSLGGFYVVQYLLSSQTREIVREFRQERELG